MDCRNPYIENFIKVLIEKKGEKLEPDAQERLIEGLNRLLENMLGRNMVASPVSTFSRRSSLKEFQ